MTPRLIVVVKDPFILQVVSMDRDVERHQQNHAVIPFRQVPDMDVVMRLPPEKEFCIHAKKVEDENDPEAPLIEARCSDRALKAQNGFLCHYHNRFLNPRPELPYQKAPKFIPKVERDLYQMLPELALECKGARETLADNEIHDHQRFERLKDVQVDEKVMRKYLERR